MTDTKKLKKLAEQALDCKFDSYVALIASAKPQEILSLIAELEQLKAENDRLRAALQVVESELTGNILPLTNDLVNTVSGLNNGAHSYDIYEEPDWEIINQYYKNAKK
ncbi:hypothetical protein EST35_0058 [Pseudomonas phage vB_PaeM_PA5oct]|uniref:Uncharacterized protein n=1 Tax=Pseudomonas phage vB_PaeM_PA5oct TaxID=2163605 RepID=A0A4Y5JUV0_9CAUD|nr:hypothetical protein PQE65_gp424 [Pseudomonas phage vB_PaeM_PA5oct]QCG75941.1 hypothetical protein EST35_0058 [Pseudomonas phage vB_PaeM_PA5oct]